MSSTAAFVVLNGSVNAVLTAGRPIRSINAPTAGAAGGPAGFSSPELQAAPASERSIRPELKIVFVFMLLTSSRQRFVLPQTPINDPPALTSAVSTATTIASVFFAAKKFSGAPPPG